MKNNQKTQKTWKINKVNNRKPWAKGKTPAQDGSGSEVTISEGQASGGNPRTNQSGYQQQSKSSSYSDI